MRSITPPWISEEAHEAICHAMEDAAYDPTTAARESESGLFLDLHAMLLELRKQLEGGSNSQYHRLWISFCRTHFASPMHLHLEYKVHCSELRLPANCITIERAPTSADGNDSVADRLLYTRTMDSCQGSNTSRSSNNDALQKCDADFLVLGAIGKGGPAVDQVGHVPRDVLLRMTPSDSHLLIVPPAPINSMVCKQYVFVVAVDRCSDQGIRCLDAAFELMRTTDAPRIVHLYKTPIIGSYDDQPFAKYHDLLTTIAQTSKNLTSTSGSNSNSNSYSANILPLAKGSTVAESVQEYVATHNASYLIIRKTGDTAAETPSKAAQEAKRIDHVASALLFSPRCAIYVCG
ncbi:hypothetical protein FI667_g10352, partial [Globisporangium splendens]